MTGLAAAVVVAAAAIGSVAPHLDRVRVPPVYDQALKALIENNPGTGKPIDNIEELVAALPAEMRGHFTFVHQSRSPSGGLGERRQGSVDPMNPRVILYTSDARLMAAFSSNTDKPDYDVAEFLRFSDDTASFQLSRFVLPAAVRRDPSLAKEARHNGEVNPPECLRCHGQDVRPLLDSYPLWPGFYGGASDSFQSGTEELANYRAFLARRRDTGVFKQLVWPTGTHVPPYIDPDYYDHEASVGREEDLARAPNTILGMALGELNRKRIERKLAASPDYRKYRRGLIAMMLGCQAPPMERAAVAPVAAAINEDNTSRIERLGFIPRGPGNTYLSIREMLYPANLAQILYAAWAVKVSPRDFSMSLEDGAVGLYDGILSGMYQGRPFYLKEDLLVEMLRRLGREEPEFARYFATYHATSKNYPFGEKLNFNYALAACPLLLERQRESGIGLPMLMGSLVSRPPSPRKSVEGAEVPACSAPGGPVARCIACHEGDEAFFTGRSIPLSEPSLLLPRLLQKSTTSERTLYDEILARMGPDAGPGRMPPHGAAATPEEVREMRKYLESVKAQAAP